MTARAGAKSVHQVLDTLQYVRQFAGQTVLVKLGGAALQDVGLVESLCADFALARSVGVSVVLVHGGGPAINEELTAHGITWEFIEGQRVTTAEMMGVVEMVLCGQVNRRIVRTLNRAGVLAVGVSGADARMLQCRQADARLGRVGKIERVNIDYVQMLLRSQQRPGTGYIPVIAPVGVGEDGEAFNINADWAASKIAVALGIGRIVYLTDQDGILDGEKRVISELDAGGLTQLIETGVVQGGMLAKARTMIDALTHGVNAIHVLNGRRPHALIEELFTDRGVGTVCRSRARETRPRENEHDDADDAYAASAHR